MEQKSIIDVYRDGRIFEAKAPPPKTMQLQHYLP